MIDKKNILIFSLFTSLAVYGTYLSALRSAFIGLLVLGAWFLVRGFWLVVRRNNYKNLLNDKNNANNLTPNSQPPTTDYQSLTSNSPNQTTNYEPRTTNKTTVFCVLCSVFLTIILSALLITLIPKKDIINYRFENLMAIDNLQFKGDPAIHSRLVSYELSFKMIEDNLVFGSGFGGFNGYNNIEWTKAIKYPHNLFLEMFAETGIIGLLVLSILFFVVFKSSYK